MNQSSKSQKEKKHYKIFQYVGDIPIISTKTRLLFVFFILILLSNFCTNFITLRLSSYQVKNLTNKVLVSQLSDLYRTASNQYELYSYSQNEQESLELLQKSARTIISTDSKHGVAFGFNSEGNFLFFASGDDEKDWRLSNSKNIKDSLDNTTSLEGYITFESPFGEKYTGVYKFHPEWQCYLIRAEKNSDVQHSLYIIFALISLIILILTIIFIFIGFRIFGSLLDFIGKFSTNMYEMQKNKKLTQVNLDGASNDDITYLAASFNSLSATFDNLLQIFQKFVPKDVLKKARAEQEIRLEGSQQELTILFSDIKSFTTRTEVLGSEIIDLLNVQYSSVINKINTNNGVIGSIIGDAILASYGKDDTVESNKSLDAIKSAWQITFDTNTLREKISSITDNVQKYNSLTAEEQKFIDAVMLDVGVGIDCGTVFYGNIGSNERMAPTVIGDNVNAASRFEALTRIYKLPVIISETVKNDALKDQENANRYRFYEIDTVQVKGKTEGIKIYFPYDTQSELEEWKDSEKIEKAFVKYQEGLEKYYSGDWKGSKAAFKKSKLDCCSIFLERMGSKSKAPDGWNGIWVMQTK